MFVQWSGFDFKSGGSRIEGFQSSPGQDKYSGVREAPNLVDKNKIIFNSSETVNKTKSL